MTNPIVHVQASGLWKAKPVDVEAALRTQMAQAHVITLTEADKAARRATIVKVCNARGWGYQLGGAHAADDCGVIWDERRFEKVYAAQVICKGNRGKGDPKAACVVLHDKLTGERILFSAMHLPHAVDLAGRWRPGSKYISRWKAEAASWLAETARIAAQQKCAATILSADWNVNIKSKHFRDWFDRHVPATPTLDYKRLPKGGTHGYRLIDFAMTRGRIAIIGRPEILPKTKASDHRAIKTVFEVVPAVVPKPAPAKPAPKEEPVTRLPRNLPDILKSEGLRVVVHPGWETRGRPGSFAPVGVLCHHTATGPKTSDAATVNLLIKGRSDLPGPLAQLGLDRSGRVHIIAAGRANHAGKAKASGTVAAGDGNTLYIGIEAFNDGVGEPWPRVQYDAYVKLCAALSKRITGNSSATVRGHKETSVTGKIDPRFDMGKFRAAVRAHMNTGSTSTSQKDWFDMATKAEKAELRAEVAAAIREMKFPVIGGGGKPKEWTLAQFLHNLENDQDNDRQLLREIKAAVDALLAANSKGVK